MLVFEEREKPEYLEKNLLEQGKEPTTNLTHIRLRRWELNPGHIGGRLVLLPLRHPCSPKLQLGEKGNWESTQVNKLILTWINLILTCDIDIWIF